MIQLRRSHDRGRSQTDWLTSYHTFSFGEYRDPNHHHFGALRVINEDWVAPSRGFGMHGHQDMEIITYVLKGALSHRDSLGTGATLRPGEVQRMTAGTGIEHSEMNLSPDDTVHLLQIWIEPECKGLPPSYEQKQVANPNVVNQWQLLASPDGRDGSVTVRQDMTLWVAYLEAGASLSVSLADDRQGWVQVCCGQVTLNESSLLTAGDGAGIQAEPLVTLTCHEAAEVLWFNLAQ